MREFIRQHLAYPSEALAAQVEGTVRLRLTINHFGKVSQVKVITSVGYGCDEEATRVAKLFQFTKPKKKKLRAKFSKTINFHFKHPGTSTTAPQVGANKGIQQLTYNIQPSTTESDSKEDKGGYEYTIKF